MVLMCQGLRSYTVDGSNKVCIWLLQKDAVDAIAVEKSGKATSLRKLLCSAYSMTHR